MPSKFQLNEKLILVYLLIVFSMSITVPQIHFLNDISVKIFIFITVLLMGFSFSSVVNLNFSSPDLLEFVFILVVGAFLISCFYINFDANFNPFALLTILTYIINFVMFFLILGKNFRLNSSKFDKFINLILIFAVFLSLVSLIFFIFGFHFLSQYSHTSAGLFGHPNTTSMFYTICTPVLFYKYFSKKISFPVFITLLLLFIIVLLLTFSRAGYIGVGVGILIYTFYKSRTLFVIVSLLVAFIAVTVVLDFATSKVDSSASRFLLILAAYSLITRTDTTMLWGYGPVNGTEVFMEEKFFFGNEPVPNPHNLLLQLSIHFGVLFTLLTTLSVTILLIKGMFLKFKNDKFKNDHRLSLCMTVIIALIVQNFFEDVLVNVLYFVMPVFFLFCGYVYYSLKFKNEIVEDL